ncbi:C1 family peptidase [Hyphomonas oceanitis]|uniref:Peptidase C1A, papain n=1 Tax=Hyphomonas oceanitis SCH89 TaxID=1280953 RepID=A0A059G474_9PROT|nr:C1 family peptidase [Hyphomonas oceanitis]KDA01278.1 peptidase C1A, papain [Hyphomonas oceanitis SCH89]
MTAAASEDLSIEYLFYHSVQQMPAANPDEGTTFDSTASALLSEGQPVDHVWPYADTQAYGVDWAPPVHSAPVYKANFEPIPPDFDAIASQFLTGRTVVMGLIITDAFYRCDHSGMLPSLAPDTERGGHAVLGVGSASDGTDHFILIRNSWGAGWGMSGHAWLSRAYIELHLIEARIVAQERIGS